MLDGHFDSIYCMSVFPDGKRIATGAADKKVKIWIFDTSKPHRGGCRDIKTLHGHNKLVHDVAALSDVHLASSCLDTAVRIWDVTTGSCVRKLTDHQAPITSLFAVGLSNSARHVHGYVLCGTKGGACKLWLVDKGVTECLGEFGGNQKEVTAIGAVPSCKTPHVFVAGYDNGELRVWAGEVRGGNGAHGGGAAGAAGPSSVFASLSNRMW